MTKYDFPSDERLIELANDIYRSLKRKIMNKQTMNEKMTNFFRFRHKITLTKVIDKFDDREELHLVLKKDEFSDSVSAIIRHEEFAEEKPNLGDFPLGLPPKYQHIEDHHRFFYEFMHRDMFEQDIVTYERNVPDFIFEIPSFLLGTTSDFVSEYIMDRYLLADKFDGKEFQKKIGSIRALSLDSQTKKKLCNILFQ